MSVNIKRIITIIIMVSVVGLISLGAYMVVQKSDHRPQDSKQLSEPAIDPKAVAGGADKAWLSQAMEKIKAQEYELSKNKQGLLQAPNRKHNFRMTVHENKVGFEPRTISSEKEEKSKTKKWQWQWETDQMGRLGNMESVDKGERSVQGNMVTYDRKQMKEWYENKPEGIEQGFVIYKKPVAGPKKSSGSDPWVMIQSCRIEGLCLRMAADHSSIDFVDEHQAVIMRYGQLKVKDATDKLLPSEIRVEENTIIVAYQDANAKYPIVIDPLMTNPGWTAESDQANASFGYSVASAGDVNGDGYGDVIVGAYEYDNGHTDEGRAYVYHGSSSGLAATDAWTAESDQANASFGYSVASAGDVNGDGYSDVIVGAPFYDDDHTDEGRAYVYHGSSSGLVAIAYWTAEGNQTYAYFGCSVASAGDVNGDGYSEVIVGAYGYDNGETDEGRAYVYHGSSGGLVNPAAWTAEGDQANAYFGRSVASSGDVNGDGYSDVIVGAHLYDNGADDEGRVFVYQGSSFGLASTAAWTAESDQTYAEFGISVASAGDVNGDGYSDVIVGAYGYNNGEQNEGRVFVYQGSSLGLANTAAWTAESDQTLAYFGISVASAGDVNGDGYSDVIVGAYYYDNGQTNEGRAYVYQGSSSGLANTADWTAESDQISAEFGRSVASAGDVNGDGYSDVIVGARRYDNGQTNEGRAYVYHGSSTGLANTAAWTAESDQTSAYFGLSVASAGDVNGDGYSDVIVGAFCYDNGESNEGRAFVYHGSSSGLAATAAWTAESNQGDAYFGNSVASAGDVNGDGYGDVIVGARYYQNGEAGEGRAYVYHGSSSGLAATANWTAESDQVDAYFGLSVASAGDVNGDGYSDVIVGAFCYDNGESNEGRAFIYHGSISGLAATANWIAESNQANAEFGYSVASAGDVNGDGYSDVIVGAYRYDNGEPDEGRAYVYHGSSSGLAATANWTAESDQISAEFGCSVASAGDVNGDGYSDVIVGAYGYDNGENNEGRAYAYYGSSSGLTATANWTAESDQTSAYFGNSVASSGDVNGDGYSDVIVGSNRYDNGESNEGRAFVYYGNDTVGLSVIPRQARADGSQLIMPVGMASDLLSNTAFRVRLFGRSTQGRIRARLQVQIAESGQSLVSGTMHTQAGYTDLGVPGAEMEYQVSGLNALQAYYWRARLLYDPAQVNNGQLHSPWFRISKGNLEGNADMRTGPEPPLTATSTMSPTVTLTATITPTLTVSPTATPTATITLTPTVTQTSGLANIDLKGKAVLAYPNPAQKQMKFLMHLDKATDVEINIYNLTGERIAKLKESMPAGRGQVLIWNCADIAPGIYLAKVYFNSKEKQTIKLAVMR